MLLLSLYLFLMVNNYFSLAAPMPDTSVVFTDDIKRFWDKNACNFLPEHLQKEILHNCSLANTMISVEKENVATICNVFFEVSTYEPICKMPSVPMMLDMYLRSPDHFCKELSTVDFSKYIDKDKDHWHYDLLTAADFVLKSKERCPKYCSINKPTGSVCRLLSMAISVSHLKATNNQVKETDDKAVAGKQAPETDGYSNNFETNANGNLDLGLQINKQTFETGNKNLKSEDDNNVETNNFNSNVKTNANGDAQPINFENVETNINRGIANGEESQFNEYKQDYIWESGSDSDSDEYGNMWLFTPSISTEVDEDYGYEWLNELINKDSQEGASSPALIHPKSSRNRHITDKDAYSSSYQILTYCMMFLAVLFITYIVYQQRHVILFKRKDVQTRQNESKDYHGLDQSY